MGISATAGPGSVEIHRGGLDEPAVLGSALEPVPGGAVAVNVLGAIDGDLAPGALHPADAATGRAARSVGVRQTGFARAGPDAAGVHLDLRRWRRWGGIVAAGGIGAAGRSGHNGDSPDLQVSGVVPTATGGIKARGLTHAVPTAT